MGGGGGAFVLDAHKIYIKVKFSQHNMVEILSKMAFNNKTT